MFSGSQDKIRIHQNKVFTKDDWGNQSKSCQKCFMNSHLPFTSLGWGWGWGGWFTHRVCSKRGKSGIRRIGSETSWTVPDLSDSCFPTSKMPSDCSRLKASLMYPWCYPLPIILCRSSLKHQKKTKKDGVLSFNETWICIDMHIVLGFFCLDVWKPGKFLWYDLICEAFVSQIANFMV